MGEEVAVQEVGSWGTPQEEARSAVGNAILGVAFDAYGGAEGYANAYSANRAEVSQNLAAFAARFPDPTAVPPEVLPSFVGDETVRWTFETAVRLYEVAVSKGLNSEQLSAYVHEQTEAEDRQVTLAELAALGRYDVAWSRERQVPED